ncbi:hypothetical protein FRC02_004489 [Tulasnella sp. 418]|nr:hypothetical protein FRC02_004489 [Tulasnella sp. 418]
MSGPIDDNAGGFILPTHDTAAEDAVQVSPKGASVTAMRALSAAQERRLVEYLESQFLEITRAYKKRAEPSTTLPDLPSYLTTLHPLLALILLIPPVDPSGSLRVSYLLRLTGDFFDGVASYPLISALPGSGKLEASDLVTVENILVQVLDWITELDKGWAAVLNSQSWDSSAKHAGPSYVSSRGVTQTERTRLRSLILQGREKLEDWMGEGPPGVLDADARETFIGGFWRTLSALGANPEDAPLSISGLEDDEESDDDIDYTPGGLVIT